MDLGNRIRLEREKLHLSQDELASRLNISRQAVSKWETGKSYPDIEIILALSALFNLTLDELVKSDKSFRDNLIKEGKSRITGLTILGFILVALAVITVVWGGSEVPFGLVSIDYLSYLLGGLVLLTIGLLLIRWLPVWAHLGSLYLTALAGIVYVIVLEMPMYATLSGIVVIAGAAWWLSTRLLKGR